MNRSYKIKPIHATMRLDRWIKNNIGKYPQSLLEKSIRKGKIKLNKKKTTGKKMRYLPLLLVSVILGQDSTDIELDLDAMWENTVWEEIQDVVSVGYEVEKITAVAGVRGAEAEDEALALLYYRKSMRGLSKLDLQKALGKLILKKEKMLEKNLDTSQINTYIRQIQIKLKRV